jgi:hypothetical protein
MEALTAASVAALTIYDMLKAVERGISIEAVRLMAKDGGKSGSYRAEEPATAPARHVALRRASAVQIKARRARPSASVKEVVTEPPQRKNVTDAVGKRDAMRRFMQARGLTAHAWARDAGMPVGVLYSFLHGRSHALSRAEEQKLAQAAGVDPEDLYRG